MASMGDGGKTKLESVREWVVEHKLRTVGNFFFIFLGDMIFSLLMLKTYFCLLFFWWVGGLWLSGVAGSIAYNWSRPSMKTSVKIIHARYLFSILIIMFFSQNILEVLVRLAFICIY